MIMMTQMNHAQNNSGAPGVQVLDMTAVAYSQNVYAPVAQQTPNPPLFEINAGNFLTVVPLVELENYSYYGENTCRICGNQFSDKQDHRMLPCRHVFHGGCIHNWMIIRNLKYCPVDNAPYA